MADEKFSEPKNVVSIVTGKNVRVENYEWNVFRCVSCDIRDFEMEFESAYQLVRSGYGSGIENCTYRVNGRKFTDISFAKGTMLEILQGNERNGVQLRQYEDGKKFLLFRYDVPTFDSSDREYDGTCLFAAYRDEEGVKLIHCHYGYKLPRIYFYMNLKKSCAEFDKLLEYLNE